MRLFPCCILLVLFLAGGCQSGFKPGIFEAKKSKLLDKVIWYLEGKRFIRGNVRLELAGNQTFQFKTCGCQSSGTWYFQNDTIFLAETAARFTKAGARKKCSTSNYRLSGKRLFRLQYDGSSYVECLEPQ